MTDQKTAVQPEAELPTFKRRGRIVLSLLAVLVFVGLAPLGTVAWKLIQINRDALTISQQQYQLLLADSIGKEVDLQIEMLTRSLTREAQTLASSIRRRGNVAPDEVRALLEDVAGGRFTYLRYSYFRANDVEAIEFGELDPALLPVFDDGLTHAAETLARNLPLTASLSDPLLIGDRTKRVAVVCSAPVVSGNRFRGVLSALIDIESAWHEAAARKKTGHVIYGIDRHGRVFASTDPASVPPGQDRRHSALVSHFLSQPLGGETMPYVVVEDGVEKHYLSSYEVTRQKWGVFVEASLEDVYLPVQRLVSSTLKWSLAVLGLAALVAVFFARSLSDPINRLVVASEAFARGEFASRVAVRTRNEIGQLACTFNRMAAEIEDHIRRLKRAAEENNELFLGTIRALAQAIDAKDPYTRGHSVRVNRYSVILARRLGLPRRQVRDIYVASLLHDVGKIGIHDSVLNKPGQLTEEEFELMKAHPVLGANIMAPIRQMKRMLPGLRWHHERMQGTGYPDGLKGDEIPLMARIIAVADTFDAVTTARPYQETMTFDQGSQVINKLSGVALDPTIVAAFNKAYAAGEIRGNSEPAGQPETAPSAVHGA